MNGRRSRQRRREQLEQPARKIDTDVEATVSRLQSGMRIRLKNFDAAAVVAHRELEQRFEEQRRTIRAETAVEISRLRTAGQAKRSGLVVATPRVILPGEGAA